MSTRRIINRYFRRFNDKLYVMNRRKSLWFSVCFLLVILIVLIYIKREVSNVALISSSYDEILSTEISKGDDLVFNGRFSLYELNKTRYPVERDFKTQIDEMYKIVHLDLKGSPPKMAYLKSLIKYFKEIGVNGVLIEYEDMFPYDKSLSSIANRNAYKKEELKEIFSLLTELDILIIPLVQTYGHLEFVLKLNEFKYLREAAQHFQVITPCLEDTYEKVIFRMLDQMLDLHPSSLKYIHIGCDEVYHYSKHDACKKFNYITLKDYFIKHVTKIIEYVKSKRPNLKVILWDDVIRKHFNIKRDSENLRSFTKLFQPMIWNYNVDLKISDETWSHYSFLFDKVWIAGAFKGATFQKAIMPNSTKHYMNHLEWMKVVHKMYKKLYFNGIVYTGWSRYDHLQPICELMPAGTPTLVFLVKVLQNYGNLDSSVIQFTEHTRCNYKHNAIGFTLDPTFTDFMISKDSSLSFRDLNTFECTFPGNFMYDYLLKLKSLIDFYELKQRLYSTIMNDYNLANGYVNTMIYEYTLNDFYPKLKNEFIAFNETFEKYFVDNFYSDLIVEFKNIYIKPYINDIEQTITKLTSYRVKDTLPARPYY